MKLANWGNYPVVETRLDAFSDLEQLARVSPKHERVIARGLGRSYGDASLARRVISTLSCNRILDFDEEHGEITCEAGVSLADILEVFVPRGWFPGVTPGTKFVTVGGAIAADIHGKNHHQEGSFSNWLISLDLWTGDRVVTCSRKEHADLFWATCGGMGLTGIILQARFRLKRIATAHIVQKTLKARCLEEVMALFEQNAAATYSVAWIDCLRRGKARGRSLLFLGEHAVPEQLPPPIRPNPLSAPSRKNWNVPVFLPNFALNRFTVKLFNTVYFRLNKAATRLVPYEPFFYPLDRLGHWNRIYGRGGFTQYQFVLPLEGSAAGLPKILNAIATSGEGSFLAVLKLFGEQSGLLSFPMKGYTLALDFPIKPAVLELLDSLDEIVLEYGGRIYLAKDARMTAKTFFESYPRVPAFLESKKGIDPATRWASHQSERLEVTP